MVPRVISWRLGLVALGTLVLVGGTALLGPSWLPWSDITGQTERSAFWQFRVPRTLLGAAAGAGLAIGGVVFQVIFRNPLAEPYTLGIASGASLAAAMGFLAGWGGTVAWGLPRLMLLAFGGAVVAMALVFTVSRLRPQSGMARLLLAGVCVAYMCSAGILLVTFLADRTVTNDIVIWMMGGLYRHRPLAALEIAVVLIPVTLLVAAHHRVLDLLHFGPQLAATRGAAVEWTIWTSFAGVGVLTAVIVGNCGPIGFVGLMMPHIGRALFGTRTLPLLVGAGLLGAAFLTLCDGLARSLPTVELPVGVVTNTIGAAFFLYLLVTRDIETGTARG